MINSIHIFV